MLVHDEARRQKKNARGVIFVKTVPKNGISIKKIHKHTVKQYQKTAEAYPLVDIHGSDVFENASIYREFPNLRRDEVIFMLETILGYITDAGNEVVVTLLAGYILSLFAKKKDDEGDK